MWPGVWMNCTAMRPDRHRVPAVHLHEVRAEAAQELPLGLVHVHLGADAAEQLLDARDVEPEEMAADVVLVRVSHQHAAELHAVLLDLIDDRVDLPRGIDDDAVPRLRVPDQVHEVLHRAQLELPQVDRVAHRYSVQYPSTQTRS